MGCGPPSAATSGCVLSVLDIAVDSHTDCSFALVHLHHSKLGIFGVGATVVPRWVDGPVCPGNALLAYLALRGLAPGPLFVFEDGSPLSRQDLGRVVRSALESQGMDVRGFGSHGFCIGAATTAAACGVEDSLIQALGRWKSSTFTTYIQTPKESLISISSVLLFSTRR